MFIQLSTATCQADLSPAHCPHNQSSTSGPISRRLSAAHCGAAEHADARGDMLRKVSALCAAGHGAIIHAATVEDSTLIGMGATILDGATVFSWPARSKARPKRTHSMLSIESSAQYVHEAPHCLRRCRRGFACINDLSLYTLMQRSSAVGSGAV